MRSIMVVAMGLAVAGCSDDVSGAAATFTAALSGQKEIPVVAGSQNGVATCTVASPNVSCTVTFAGLSGAPTAMHIHAGNANQTGSTNGPVRVDLCGAGTALACPTTTSGTFAAGNRTVIAGTTFTFDSLNDRMHNYGLYVNVHTTANTGGEMRGQLFRPVAP